MSASTVLGSESAGTEYLQGVGMLLELGGPVVFVLLLMSIAGLAIVLFKLATLRVFSRRSFDAIDICLESQGLDEPEALIQQLRSSGNPCADILVTGLKLLQNPINNEEQIREELVRQGNGLMGRVNSLLRVLEQISYLAPLLGLLGTVLGIIDVFRGLASSNAMADAGFMAGGIWEALLTTAVGMSIAIPFALASAILESRSKYIQDKVQSQLSRLFTLKLQL